MAVAIIHSPLPSSRSSRSRARIHMYLAPDTMDSEMAPLVDRPTETPPLDRKTEDDSGNGRRSERRRRGERGRRGSERASGGKTRGALLPGTHAEIARESLLGHESPGRIVYKVVPSLRRPRERATIVRANVKGAARVEDEPKGGAGYGLCDHRDAEKGWNGARGRAEKTTMLRNRAQVVVPLVCSDQGST